jgi:hypothetical protein
MIVSPFHVVVFCIILLAIRVVQLVAAKGEL